MISGFRTKDLKMQTTEYAEILFPGSEVALSRIFLSKNTRDFLELRFQTFLEKLLKRRFDSTGLIRLISALRISSFWNFTKNIFMPGFEPGPS